MIPRAPPIYYSCGVSGHIARNCQQQPRAGNQNDQGPLHANSAEFFDAALTEYWDGYGYSYGPWYLDSGASGHIAADSSKIDQSQLTSGVQIQEVRTGGGKPHTVRGTGTATVKTNSGEIKLTNVKYVPSMRKNLVSVGSITDNDRLVVFSDKHCWVLDTLDHKRVIAFGHRDPSNGLYLFGQSFDANILEHKDKAQLWHKRYGHLSYFGLEHLSKASRVMGLPKIDPHHESCESCLAGRQHRERFPCRSETRAVKPGEKFHSDLIGPLQQASVAGSRYILVFTDDHSRKSWTFFLRSKDETFSKFRLFKERTEAETGSRMQILRTDRGGEYMSTEFKNYCHEHGIKQELTQASTPQQNGISERRNRTIIERARSLCHECNLPTFLWTEAVATANYLVNRSPTRANGGMTPEEKYSGTKPKVNHLRIFGSLAYLHVPKENRKKLDSKT
jgi:hypothetical protein